MPFTTSPYAGYLLNHGLSKIISGKTDKQMSEYASLLLD